MKKSIHELEHWTWEKKEKDLQEGFRYCQGSMYPLSSMK